MIIFFLNKFFITIQGENLETFGLVSYFSPSLLFRCSNHCSALGSLRSHADAWLILPLVLKRTLSPSPITPLSSPQTPMLEEERKRPQGYQQCDGSPFGLNTKWTLLPFLAPSPSLSCNCMGRSANIRCQWVVSSIFSAS